MTHDLLSEVLGELDVSCTRVAVTELRENTFYASITLAVNGREMEIDSRPSDALALAVRAGAPIFAAEEVIAESAIEFEHEVEDTEEVVEKFKDFLDQVTPEDFAGDELSRRAAAQAAARALSAIARIRSTSCVEADPGGVRRLRQQARLRQARARCSPPARTARRPRAASGRPARSRRSPSARYAATASSCVRAATPSGSSAGHTKRVRPIS